MSDKRAASTTRSGVPSRSRLRPVLRLAGLAATLSVTALAAAAPALANGGVAMAVDVKNSRQTMRSANGGSCTWEVVSDVTVINVTSQTLTIGGVDYSVSWTAPGNRSGVQTQVTVVQDGGLVPGVSLAPDERRVFPSVMLSFAIPCGADFGDLAVRVSSPAGTGSGDAPFLSGGTPVPPAAVGALALAALVGGSLLVRQRRGQRHSPLPV